MLAALALAVSAVGAGLNGKWTGEVQSKKRTSTVTLDLEAHGSTLAGTMSLGKRGRGAGIKEGKIDGANFSFKVSRKKKEHDIEWAGTLDGDRIQLKQRGGKRGRAITLKRTSPPAPGEAAP
ncbi:MAG: hypothetical protein R2729_12115 [Bryobacteraceae bacterium]